MADTKKDSTDSPKVVSASDKAKDNANLVETTNKDVEQAADEAATRLKGQRRESFNVTDSVLGEDEEHGVNVKRAQAASFGEEYDPKSDPEAVIIEITPVASQNQNNLKHPSASEFTDPHAAKTYLGHPL